MNSTSSICQFIFKELIFNSNESLFNVKCSSNCRCHFYMAREMILSAQSQEGIILYDLTQGLNNALLPLIKWFFICLKSERRYFVSFGTELLSFLLSINRWFIPLCHSLVPSFSCIHAPYSLVQWLTVYIYNCAYVAFQTFFVH